MKYTNLDEYTISFAKHNWMLKPFRDNTIVICLTERPYIWKRFWLFIFFGFKFERIK